MSPEGIPAAPRARAESPEESFKRAVNELRERVFANVRALPSREVPRPVSAGGAANDNERAERLRLAERAEEPLPFHNEAHSLAVEERTARLIAALRAEGVEISERTAALAGLIAINHDRDQSFREVTQTEPEERPDKTPNPYAGRTKVMRVRDTGNNEKRSAEAAIYDIRSIRALYPGVFTEEDEQTIKDAIYSGTTPGFDPAHSTVYQPGLDKGGETSGLLTRLVALADLGTAGMDGPEKFLPEGDALFREENLDIADAIEEMCQGKPIDEGTKEYFRSRMLGWERFQGPFAHGRQELIDRELAGFTPEVREALEKKVFTRFHDSEEAAREKAKAREHMSFEELALDMGYDLTPHQREELRMAA